MGMTRGTTICSKHDDIKSTAIEIQELLDKKDANYEEYECSQLCDNIITLAEDAKQDGQSMEDALREKSARTVLDKIDKLGNRLNTDDIEDLRYFYNEVMCLT